MLTLKAPIKLHTAQALTMASAESFGERIIGNYHILNAKIAPKDLLFLLTAPPEVLQEQGGMTTLVNNDTRVDLSNVTVDVVNHVINRILLDGTSQFTYQDQVYITSVLNRLGITNVEQFMAQVRQLRIETENTKHMTKLYRSELERTLRYKLAEEKTVKLPVPAAAEGEEQVGADPVVEMSVEIFNRLGTAKLYETIHHFQKNITKAENHIQHNELCLAEHLRLSNELSLTQIKQQLFEQPQIDLTHHVNHYELGTILEVPGSEEEVLSQAAVAALVSAVDNTVTEVINRPEIYQQQWMRLERALWQSATNAVFRYESYHNYEENLPVVVELNAEHVWNRYATEMRQYLTLRQYQNERIEQLALKNVFLRSETTEHSDTENYHIDQEKEPAAVQLTAETVLKRYANDMRQYLTQQHLQNRQGDQYISKKTFTADDTALTHLTQVTEETDVILSGRTEIRSERERLRAAIRELVVTQMTGKVEEKLLPMERQTLLHREINTADTSVKAEEEVQQTVPQPRYGGERGDAVTVVPPKYTQPMPESSLPPMELTAREAEQQAPELLVEQIQQIDQHNRTVLQQIQNAMEIRNLQPPKVPVPDLKRTMRDSLRALEQPELVLREIYEEGARQREQKSPYTAREEAILSQASPADRVLYERVLAYQKDPHGALEQGLVRRGDPAALQAQLRNLEVQEPQVLEHLNTMRETKEYYEETETVLERILHHTVRGARVDERRMTPGAVRIVHKQTAPDISEEVLQRLEQRNTSEIVKTENNESVTRRNTSHTEISNEEHTVVQRTTEDITELVNRTLSKQMRTISDQVYRQMEKRLQTERSRRGRF